MDETTQPGRSLTANIGAPERTLPALVLAWSRDEPERAGEVLILPAEGSGAPWTFGRDGGADLASRARPPLEDAAPALRALGPRALGLAPVTHDGDTAVSELAAELGRALDELAQAYPTLLAAVERRVADRFGVGSDQPLRGALSARAKRLTPLAVDLRLRAFLGRAIEADAGRAEWVEGLAMVVGNRPPSEWYDGEFARFEIGLDEIHALFVRAEGLAAGPSRAVGGDDEAQREILRFLEDRLGPRRETWVAALGRALQSIREGKEDTP